MIDVNYYVNNIFVISLIIEDKNDVVKIEPIKTGIIEEIGNYIEIDNKVKVWVEILAVLINVIEQMVQISIDHSFTNLVVTINFVNRLIVSIDFENLVVLIYEAEQIYNQNYHF